MLQFQPSSIEPSKIRALPTFLRGESGRGPSRPPMCHVICGQHCLSDAWPPSRRRQDHNYLLQALRFFVRNEFFNGHTGGVSELIFPPVPVTAEQGGRQRGWPSGSGAACLALGACTWGISQPGGCLLVSGGWACGAVPRRGRGRDLAALKPRPMAPCRHAFPYATAVAATAAPPAQTGAVSSPQQDGSESSAVSADTGGEGSSEGSSASSGDEQEAGTEANAA